AWQTAARGAGPRPRIEDYLGDSSEPERSLLLRELLLLELAYRRRGGERLLPAEYQARFPEHAGLIPSVFGAAFPEATPALPAPGPADAAGGAWTLPFPPAVDEFRGLDRPLTGPSGAPGGAASPRTVTQTPEQAAAAARASLGGTAGLVVPGYEILEELG